MKWYQNFAGSSATALKNGATVDADSMSSLANAGVELCAGNWNFSSCTG